MDGKILITFFTTTQAMRMEDCCRKAKIRGRLIPVPGRISAGCGVGWMAEKQEQEKLEVFMREQGLAWQGIHDLDGMLRRQEGGKDGKQDKQILSERRMHR